MFKLLLILKYLRRKLAPMFAAVAVALCTMMVITVISVMGGFLDQLRDTAHRITGDVVVSTGSLTGFAHYQDILQALEAQDEIAAAAPLIRTFGLLQIGGFTTHTQVMGVDPYALDRVVHYRESLYWSVEDRLAYLDETYGPDEQLTEAQRQTRDQHRRHAAELDFVEMGMTLQPPAHWQPEGEGQRHGMVMGIELHGNHGGSSKPRYQWSRTLIGTPLTLTVVPLTQSGTLGGYEPERASFIVLNESKSGLHEVDAGTVYVPFEQLQRMLKMERVETPNFDPQTGEDLPGVSVTPARTTAITVRGEPGYDLDAVHAAAQRVVRDARAEHRDLHGLEAQTWIQMHHQILAAVQNEKGLVTFLLIVISVVAVVMVLVTFYMIVLEKTRDIGILRAIGASQVGIMNVFLGYGLAVGMVGAFAGLALAYLLVTYLNDLHDWLGDGLGTAAFAAAAALAGALLGAIGGALVGRSRRRAFHLALRGAAVLAGVALLAAVIALFVNAELGPWLNATIRFQMWNPETYMFDRIPTRVDPLEAGLIVAGAILSSVAGALIPAVIASRLNPIEALRYE